MSEKNAVAVRWEVLPDPARSTERIAAGWPPDGWYPADFYRDDLTARDQLESALAHLPAAATGRFQWATGRVDERFKTLTHPGTTSAGQSGAWWWQRIPDNEGIV